jgi:tRNA threonylcarbamoyladenosine biosynthesis protein TsaB
VNVLALDAALGGFSTAVACRGQIAASRWESGQVALERGLRLIDEVLSSAQLAPEQIERLAVGIGPGSFTGLRIAIAYAKSLAAVWRRPLVPIDSFDLLEYGSNLAEVLSVVVGRPGVISARYRAPATMRRASGLVVDVLDEVLLMSPFDRAQGGTEKSTLAVVGAPKDVLDALAERAIIVRAFEPAVTPAAAAAALAADFRTPPKSMHEIRADYGELPAAKPPRF